MKSAKKAQSPRLQSKLKVQVFDANSQRTSKAKVRVTDDKKKTLDLRFNSASGFYEAPVAAPAHYTVKVSLKDHAADSRKIQVNPGEHDELFMLGRKGASSYYRGNVKVPFDPLPDHLGIVLKDPDHADQHLPKLHEAARQFKLEEVKSGDNIRKNGLFIYRFAPDTPENRRQEIQDSLSREEFIFLAAPILKLFADNATLLTDNVIVKFKGNVTKDQAANLAKRNRLEMLRSIPYAGNAYQYRLAEPLSYKSLEVCERLVKTGLVEYAEPDLWHTGEDDLITPTDWLFPEQWDHPIINTPAAWQSLADVNPAQKFGAPDIVIAVVDSGIEAAHPAFSGTVSNSALKVYQLFDFVNMVANNNSLGGDHGTCCAGAASGHADDPSAVLGVNEGTAGLAGNCRLIGIRRGGTETRYADVYVWAAGFNPNSTLAGFPAQINPGADIITSSFGFSIGSPISGLMKDAFDFLTTYGRGGKGVALFFSVGNFVPRVDFTLQRPWAAYSKTMACGASALMDDGVTEDISQYSGFGPMLDFCAPSHDAYVGSAPRHNPPTNYGAFTPTIQGQGNTPGRPTNQTTLSAAAVAGGATINVASATGFAVGRAVLLRAPGAADAEAHQITGVAGTTITLTPALFDSHPVGTAVAVSTRDYKNDFGGTSYATPVCAGLAALMLSANRNLTWIEVRELIRSTAVKIDPNNTDPVGRWRDAAGLISTDAGYAGPFFSQWYGYGRINAAAAVDAAVNYGFQRDLLVRDNLADAGLAPSAGTFWEGVDIWVRQANDNALPANYATHADTVHQSPKFGQDNWVYVRFKNIGSLPSFKFYIRVYIAHWPGTEFIYPDNFIPTVRPNGTIPNPLTPGTYLIGEASVDSLAAAAEGYVAVQWPTALVPPENVVVSGSTVHWHPCLLVEVSPHDGFTPPGSHVWENNNLAQKNISIDYTDSAGGFAYAGIAGNLVNHSKFLNFEIKVNWPVANANPVYIQFVNHHVERYVLAELDRKPRRDLKAEKLKDNLVFRLIGRKPVRIQTPNVGPFAFIVGGNTGKLPKDKHGLVEVLQLDDNQRPSGGLSFEIRGEDVKSKARKK